MQVLLQLFFQLLGVVIVPLAWKLLRGLGFAAVTYTGINILMDQAKDYVFQNMASLPMEWINLLGLLKVDVCINIIFSAYVARAMLWGMDKTSGSKSSIKISPK